MSEDPIRPLSEREGRRPPRGAPPEGMPSYIEYPLRAWLGQRMGPELERRIGLLLELPLGRPPTYVGIARGPYYAGDLLDVLDLFLQLDPQIQQDLAGIDRKYTDDPWATIATPSRTTELPDVAEELDRLLTDGNSTYRVARHARPLQLVNVVDSTVATAVAAAIEDAEETAGGLLSDAWVAAHAVRPDPDGAYRDAVRAVETVARPLVLPDEPGATLGKVNAHLRQAGHKWELVLFDRDGDGSVAPLLAMLERIWEGQVSRHGGGPRSRNQTPEEARAAVQIAVLVVQWLTDGVLRRRPTEAGSTS